ncbi:cell division cycle-associated protein 7 [Brassica rapa]|uniref:Zinc-finger domain-containing protein n=1 Tax=Brassica campestris TaxID=3711 RepID=M4ETN1_BRACM|nr:cell division cycle-associated protein 7 [Brassica rapa]
MLAMRTAVEASMPKSNPNNPPEIQGNPKASLYEQCREERIKENLQRMQNLGILNLARKLQSETRPGKRSFGNSNPAPKSTPPTAPSRRSSRLENTTPVTYSERDNVKGKKSKGERLLIFEGPRVEVYTEEHEKLLGNTERSWTCFVDGYGKDGKRIYDPFKGKTCHQCRQKTLGHRTQCSVCDLVQGQFCGDCLFMRYGEHVLEALDNPEWVCPVCRGICNCSLCRNHKGWVPTGPIYRRIAKLGYKSVAHYLIQTKRAQSDDATPNQASAKRSLSFQEAKQLPDIADDDDLPNEVPELQIMESQNGDSLKKEEDENTADENPSSAKRSLSFCLPSADDLQVIGDLPKAHEKTGQISSLEPKTIGDSVNTGETRSEKRTSREPNSESIGSSVITRSKRKAALEEPNPDSIGARLRQRRRSLSGL